MVIERHSTLVGWALVGSPPQTTSTLEGFPLGFCPFGPFWRCKLFDEKGIKTCLLTVALHQPPAAPKVSIIWASVHSLHFWSLTALMWAAAFGPGWKGPRSSDDEMMACCQNRKQLNDSTICFLPPVIHRLIKSGILSFTFRPELRWCLPLFRHQHFLCCSRVHDAHWNSRRTSLQRHLWFTDPLGNTLTSYLSLA